MLYGDIMKFKAKILDTADISRILTRMAHQIVEKNGGIDELRTDLINGKVLDKLATAALN